MSDSTPFALTERSSDRARTEGARTITLRSLPATAVIDYRNAFATRSGAIWYRIPTS